MAAMKSEREMFRGVLEDVCCCCLSNLAFFSFFRKPPSLSVMLVVTPEREGWAIFSSLCLLYVGGGLGVFGYSTSLARRNLASRWPRFIPDGSGSIDPFLLLADDRFVGPSFADPLDPNSPYERVGRRHDHVEDGGTERRRAFLQSLQRPRDHPENDSRSGSQEGSPNVQQQRRRSRRDLQGFAGQRQGKTNPCFQNTLDEYIQNICCACSRGKNSGRKKLGENSPFR